MLAILFISFVVVWRGVTEGELSLEISRDGFKYQQREVTRETAVTLNELEAGVERQGRAIRRLVGDTDRTAAVVESQRVWLAWKAGARRRRQMTSLRPRLQEMTEEEDLRKHLLESKERIYEDMEFVRKSLERAEAARLRMLKAAGIQADGGLQRK
jgi:hypothetical protein